MGTQTVNTSFQAKDQEEYDKIKVMLSKMNLPAPPVYNDLLKTVTINFSTQFDPQ